MVYVFHSSLKHKRLISLPSGGQEREKERKKNDSQKEWSLFLLAVYFFIRAEVHVLLKVVWGAGACRSGLHSLVKPLCNRVQSPHIEICTFGTAVKTSVDLIDTS